TSRFSNYAVVKPQLIQRRWTRNADRHSKSGQVHCYYHGHVRDHEDSLVALSTCSGLRGVILLGNDSYGLEPIKQSSTNEHLLYRLEHSQSEPFFCGVTTEASQTESHSRFDPSHTLTALLRVGKFTLHNKIDMEVFAGLMYCLVNYYKQLNVRVVLVGLEIFKNENPFSVTDPPGNVLGNFVKWRQTNLLPRVRNDDAQLIVGRSGPYSGGILGMAFVGTVCSASTAGGINVFSDNNLAYVSTVVAHEMGHNLGMIHDVYPSCTCQGPGGTCIMNAYATGSTVFSSCSASNFESLVLGGGGACLLNPATSTLTVPQCGNGILETGEQCDCGTPQECTNKCCNASTCTFSSGSTCAQGSCCQNCQVIVSGTPCRGSVNTCDLPEYCNGSAPTCPSDFYVMDGLPCQDNTAYCYEGRCQTYNYQCQQLFAPGASKAADICFQTSNLVGDKYGNCGITSTGAYVKCTMANAMCGKLQCTNVNTNNPPPGGSVSNQNINGSSCVNADFNLGPDVLDPAYVHHGSPCATGKACVSFRCVNATALLAVNLTCDAQTTCNGRGVCNNMGHCHCNDGWGPPYCDRLGRGGSVDSGPAQIDYSLRNGLLIFFLLVVPVLILLVLLLLFVFRRDSLEPCLQKLHPRHLSGHADQMQFVLQKTVCRLP
uniref:ADAM metallopeptidase domain 9 n=1 Tax=Esox lucius TaxID=8010 RepID=A0A6Q2ZB19_ESOLU